jgi:NADPH-dependent curcumin reductase CurA
MDDGREVETSRDDHRGLENTPLAFVGLMHGKNIGKMLVRV